MAGTRGAAGQILFTMKTMMQMMTIVPTIPYPNISGIFLHGYSQHPSGQYRRTPPKTKKAADTVGTWADCDKDSVDRRHWRLDYAISGAPLLPIDRGLYVVRMPATGRLQTSLAYNSSIDRNEYFVVSGHGLHKLSVVPGVPSKSSTASDERAVHSAFGFFVFSSGTVQKPGKCVFVGNAAAFMNDWRDCRNWQPGELQPAEVKNHIARKPTY